MGDGRVVVPWREDIRYTRRRAGYHGGASLAEMSVPVLVLTPTPDQLPMGWSVLAPESVEPPWWNGRRTVTAPGAAASARAEGPRRPPPPSDDVAVHRARTGTGVPSAPAPVTLGQQVVGSAVYKAQLAFVQTCAGQACGRGCDRRTGRGGTSVGRRDGGRCRPRRP